MAWAQQPKASPAAPTPSAKVQAELHRTLADLIEARAASEPDQARIQALADKAQKLRAQVTAASAGLGCPWGGPGRGFGPGYGRGPGWGGGYGRGPGRGFGWGGGYGWGFVDADGNGVCDRFEQAVGKQQ